MTSYDLPGAFDYEPLDGGMISGEFKADALEITVVDDDSRDEAFIELPHRETRHLFEGFTALLITETTVVCVDVGDKLRDRNAESLIFTRTARGTTVDLHIWGDPTKLGEPGGGSAFSVHLAEVEALLVYAQLMGLALRRGVDFR